MHAAPWNQVFWRPYRHRASCYYQEGSHGQGLHSGARGDGGPALFHFVKGGDEQSRKNRVEKRSRFVYSGFGINMRLER